MAEIVIALAGKVAEYLVAPIGRQLGYLFCYRRYTDDLRNKVQKLVKERDDELITVNGARRSRGDEIRPIVEDWLKQVDEITREAEVILMKKQNQNCWGGWCPNLKSRYQLGREAYKKAQVVVGIQTARSFPDGATYHVPPRTETFKGYESYESRDSTLKEIMDALSDGGRNKMKIIGVWGMGGVGKTTLVKQVAEQAKRQNLFSTQVYVDVSWTREDQVEIQQGISKIQQRLADMLGLEFKNEDQSTKADKLKQRLQEEKILIILDDLWKEIDLGEVGIPSCKDDDDQKYDCKIVLASRDEDLLRKDMSAQICFPIQHLPPKEAWGLFKKTAGDSVEGDELRPVAMDVVKECQGLPVAIVTIAKALKDESVYVWKNALDELKSSAPANIRQMEEKVYTCLEWSYKHLKSVEAQSLFLLCGSLSYGDISMDHLLRYVMGIDSFDRVESLEKARNKLITLVRTLKASSLLLDGEEDHNYHIARGDSRLLFMDDDNNYKCVRMHDVVRDVARNIASKHPHRFFVIRKDDVLWEEDWSETDESKGCTFISLHCKAVHRYKLPQRLVCPKLKFFLLQNNAPSLDTRIPNTFFEGMNVLKVLDLFKTSLTTLPSSLQSLANLRTLCLDGCKLGDIAVIGELKKLRVLSMKGSNIQQLPKQMVQLTNLSLLNLNSCHNLRVIPINILSNLSQLECLFKRNSFSQWTAEGVLNDGESNACLSELNHLHHLTTIAMAIPDVKLVPKEDNFFQNLTSYEILIGGFLGESYRKSKALYLRGGDESLLLRKGIGKLLKKTEELELSELENVVGCPISVSFDNLKTLKVKKCRGLKFLFFLYTASGLSQLEEMTIEDCEAMQHILAYERESEIKEDDHVGNLQLFPNLLSLQLRSLPELISFDYFGSKLESTLQGMCSQGNLHIHMPFFSYQVSFSNLEKLELIDLPKLKEIWPHQLSPSLDSWSNLRILIVKKCSSLISLISCHFKQIFKNLEEIEVSSCDVLKHVFDLPGQDTHVEILPKLETLKLENLAGLRGIICNDEKNGSTRGLFSPFMPVSFYNLKYLSISHCGKEDKGKGNVSIPTTEDGVFFGEKVSFPNLEELKLDGLFILKRIWHHQHSLEFLSKLRILSVCACPHLVNFIPSYLIQSFQNLKEVVVRDCEILEYVFDYQGLNGDNEILQKIEILRLEKLPKLGLIRNEDKNSDTRYVFSLSQLKDFHHLKQLHITNCGMLLDDKISFSPNLEVLVLTMFCKLKEIDIGNLRKLRVIRLEKLPKLSHIIWNKDKNGSKTCVSSSSIFKNFPNLRELRFTDIGGGRCGKCLYSD